MTAAAIRAAFADWRPVKSRSVLQLVLEVPIEQTKAVLDTLGAPIPGTEKWVGVALLNPPGATDEGAAKGSAAADHPYPPERSASAPGGPKRQRTLPELVGMRCADRRFQNWLFAKGSIEQPEKEETAAYVRLWCGVNSRREIAFGSPAEYVWRSLENAYLRDTNQMAEER